jgi:hypothetical protein
MLIDDYYGRPEPYISRHIPCTYGIFSREITIHTVQIYGANIQFWPALMILVILQYQTARKRGWID